MKSIHLFLFLALASLLSGCYQEPPTPAERVLDATESLTTTNTSIDQALGALSNDEISEIDYMRVTLAQAQIDSLGRISQSKITSSPGADIESMIFVFMMELAFSAEEDLRALLREIEATSAKKKNLRDAMSASKDAAAKLRQELKTAYLDAKNKSLPPLRIEEEHLEARPLELSTADISPSRSQALLPVAKDGRLDLQLVCPNSQAPVTLVLYDVIQQATLASEVGHLPETAISTQISGSTVVGVRIRANHYQAAPLRCQLFASYPRNVLAEELPWDPARRRSFIALLGELDSLYHDAYSELLRLHRIGELSQNELLRLSSAFANLRSLFGEADRVAAFDTVKEAVEALKAKLDSISEMNEAAMLRLQMNMDRRSKFISELSNILKKISETQSSITQNLK